MDPTPPGRHPTLIDPARAMTGRLDVPSARGTALVAGRYALQERIGSGGMCEVWRAMDTTLDRLVAMKLLHPHLAHDVDARGRFAVEARRAAAINHPRVVRVFDAGVDGPPRGVSTDAEAEAWMAMELIEGPSLADRMADGALPVDEALHIGVDVAEGLAAAHALGVVHRDVKPGNVLLADDGARLTDFGIARAAGEARVTATGQMVGTAAYLAPEQARGEPAAPASDVYALGCVLFEALTGRPRFTGEGPLQTALARVDVTTTVDDLGAGAPPAVARAVVDLLALDPADRPPDGTAAAARLRAVMDPVPAAPTAPAAHRDTVALPAVHAPDPAPAVAEPTGRTGQPPSRRPVLVAALVLLLVAVVAVVALRGAPGGTPDGDVAGAPDTDGPIAARPTSFDPQGGGQEHEGEVALLGDGDPATAWTTERYSSAAFGNLKDGVGVLFDLGQPVEVAEVRLLGLTAGQSLQLRVVDAGDATQPSPTQASPNPPSTLEETSVVAEVTSAAEQVALTPTGPVTARWLVIWLTGELPADGGGFRGAIGEAQVIAAS